MSFSFLYSYQMCVKLSFTIHGDKNLFAPPLIEQINNMYDEIGGRLFSFYSTVEQANGTLCK